LARYELQWNTLPLSINTNPMPHLPGQICTGVLGDLAMLDQQEAHRSGNILGYHDPSSTTGAGRAMLNWFDAKDAEDFGRTLARFLMERVPLEKDAKDKKRPIAKQLAVADKLDIQIRQFKAKNRLNIYKKAKLGSAFKYTLLEGGYDPHFVENIVAGVMTKL
jgi:hypothetical protein